VGRGGGGTRAPPSADGSSRAGRGRWLARLVAAEQAVEAVKQVELSEGGLSGAVELSLSRLRADEGCSADDALLCCVCDSPALGAVREWPGSV